MPISGSSYSSVSTPCPWDRREENGVELVFTGIVEELGRFAGAVDGHDARRLVFDAELVTGDARVGDSIAVNGCCLTVVDLAPGRWSADVVQETLYRTNLGQLSPGEPVNFERSVLVGSRLGGHLVQGHVDGTGVVEAAAPDLRARAPEALLPYLVPKGSITVDGCSLTIVEVVDGSFTVAIIPHTAALTTLGRKVPGDLVNLEVDVIAKYVERLLRAGTASPYVTPA